MICTKIVTEEKLAANRLNAKRSTGPRTEVGKNTSRFNAVKTGLLAKHVVIPLCDGEGSEEQFARSLTDLQQEFQPGGPLEEFYVGEIAKSMWRFRRATCAEKGSVRPRKLLDICFDLKAQPITDAICIVESAQRELKTTGTLSPSAYAKVLPLIEKMQACVAKLEGEIVPAAPKIDDQLLPLLERQRQLLEEALKARHFMTEKEFEDSRPTHALPSDSVLDNVLRYEAAAQKRFDWALQKLLESQERRRKAQTPASV